MFFKQVFPTLLPMLIANDILYSYNFINIINAFLNKFFKRIFNMSNIAIYIFIMSILSGTPSNAYITTNFIKNNNLSSKDASIILTYSFFLNPLFLYSMLKQIFHNNSIPIKLICINYGLNLFFAFINRNYKYKEVSINFKKANEPFTKILSNSIKHAFDTLINILGTIIFYLIICEGINIIIKNPLINCLINGLLEVTGGISKLASLNINLKAKEIIAILFMSFGGLSIHSQIKSIIADTDINTHPFFITRCFHALLATIITIFT